MNNTQLTPANDSYNTDRVRFSEPIVGTIPDSKPSISFRRIHIKTENNDGTIGDLILPTEKVFSFGISANTSMDTNLINGYTLPLVLWNKDGPTKQEKQFTSTIDRIVERIKDHLIEHKDEIERYDLERNDLKKLNPLYWKKDKGKIIEGSGPTLYPKLICSKKNGELKILTMFYDIHDNPINPIELISKRGYTKGAIKIESIFIGNKISIQIKLYECYYEVLDSGMKRLLTKPNSIERVLNKSTSNNVGINDEENSSTDDLLNSDDSDEEVSKPPPPIPTQQNKKVVRRKVVKK